MLLLEQSASLMLTCLMCRLGASHTCDGGLNVGKASGAGPVRRARLRRICLDRCMVSFGLCGLPLRLPRPLMGQQLVSSSTR